MSMVRMSPLFSTASTAAFVPGSRRRFKLPTVTVQTPVVSVEVAVESAGGGEGEGYKVVLIPNVGREAVHETENAMIKIESIFRFFMRASFQDNEPGAKGMNRNFVLIP